MLNKNNNQKNMMIEYQKPNDRAFGEQIKDEKIITINKNESKSKNVYQIEDNGEFTNSIELNYQINIDTNNGGNNNFSDINFDNIEKNGCCLKK
jgi:hypothetical protein